MRKPIVLALAAAAVAAGTALAAPASAACVPANGDICSGDTQVAFAVLPNVGTLSIVPTAATAGVGGVGTPVASTGLDTAKSVTVPLGVTTVLDSRTTTTGWTVSAAASDFALTGATGSISKNQAKFSVPVLPALPTTGLTGALTGAVVPTFSNVATTPTGTGGSATLFDAAATTVNAAAFIPVLTVNVTGATAGVYTGTVTQSVS